jgi:C_GCAxxG_C_C family probable redox protein
MQEKDIVRRVSTAKSMFLGPYNCTQSVAMAFKDVIRLEDQEIMHLASGFGFGMGGERSVCGAVSGGIMVISSTIEDPAQREEIYDKVYYLISLFKEQNGDKLACLDLIGESPGDEEFRVACPLLIEQVVRTVAEIIAHQS